MNPRERVLRVLKGEQADHVPWFGDLDYWATSLICRGEHSKEFISSSSYIDWHRDLGVGYYLQGNFPFKEKFNGCTVRSGQNGDIRFREIKTPLGTINEQWKWSSVSYSEAPVKYLVETEQDLAVYQYMYKNMEYEPDYAFLNKRKEQIGDFGVLLAYLPKSPLMQMVALDAGIMNVVMLESLSQELFRETMEIMQETISRACLLSLESPAEILMIPENLSAEMVGPNYFHKYMEDYQKFWAEKIRAKDKFSCIHMDGSLRGLLREECAVGLTFIEACTPAPVGDVSVGEWRDFIGSTGTIIWGGLPGVYFTNAISDDEFVSFVKQTLEIMASEPRYVLGVADQIPPDCLEYRIRMVRKLVEKYGRYK